jgi:hypothetical protein
MANHRKPTALFRVQVCGARPQWSRRQQLRHSVFLQQNAVRAKGLRQSRGVYVPCRGCSACGLGQVTAAGNISASSLHSACWKLGAYALHCSMLMCTRHSSRALSAAHCTASELSWHTACSSVADCAAHDRFEPASACARPRNLLARLLQLIASFLKRGSCRAD